MRRTLAVVVAVLMVLSGCAGFVGSENPTATPDGTDAVDDTSGTSDSADGVDSTDDAPPAGDAPGSDSGDAMAENPPDPDSDKLGWEGGYWYNETLSVDQSDGLNESELNAVVNRSMARVEYIRGLEFEGSVPVEVISRAEFRNQSSGNSADYPPQRRAFDNAKFEALFMINESTDSIAVQNTNTGSSVGGYYSPADEKIVIVSENTTSPKLNEVTLSQELFHALQDQKFDLTSYNQSTREKHNAVDGIVEGDGNYVDWLYEQRCDAEWDCLEDSARGGGGGLANYGPYLIQYQPYSDGPAFVRQLRERGGWEAVNAAYENPPASTEQVIHPNRYPDDKPVEPKVTDRTSGTWQRLEPEGRPNYGELGEAGVNAMLVYPIYETRGQTQIIPARHWYNLNESGEVEQFDPFNYDHPYTDGFRGDRFVAYQNDAGETGYVWKLVWDNSSQATEFLDGYERVLQFRSAEKVQDASGPGTVYRIDEGDNGFADAFRVVQQGDTVYIVNAPTVDELSNVRSSQS
ncbi:Hvo_1808 family surface protein [Haloprofundus salilacus]|uniref:Hvo_1808 family surface protein n=1 Tax=Haloprofundus salilacus TaxID=2876190 RepID=UPI001CCB5813|nr:Hvo_1808 family surface protein [Haloprofundus salilacus]